MLDYNEALRRLLTSPRITKLTLDQAPRQQGAYVLWFDGDPPVCLKVGIAGPRKGKGLKGRLQLHFSSHPGNTVLARHLVADSTSAWAQRYDFRKREQRQDFLSAECFFQTVELPNLSRRELEQFEAFLEEQLEPKYTGRVGKTK